MLVPIFQKRVILSSSGMLSPATPEELKPLYERYWRQHIYHFKGTTEAVTWAVERGAKVVAVNKRGAFILHLDFPSDALAEEWASTFRDARNPDRR